MKTTYLHGMSINIKLTKHEQPSNELPLFIHHAGTESLQHGDHSVSLLRAIGRQKWNLRQD
jgi:hypothetical protein